MARNGYQTFVADSSYFHMNRFSKYGKKVICPSFYQNPFRFIEWVKWFCHKEKISYVIPCYKDVFVFSRYKQYLKKAGILCLIADLKLLKLIYHKHNCQQWIEKMGVLTPKTYVPHSYQEMIDVFSMYQDMYLKMNYSHHGKGVFHIRSIKQLRRFENKLGQFVLQETISGCSYAVSMLYDNNYQCRLSFTNKHLKSKNDMSINSTFCMSTDYPEMQDLAKRILNRLSWVGVCMVKFKYNTATNKIYFIGIKPYLCRSLAISYVSGLNFSQGIIDCLSQNSLKNHTVYQKGIIVDWLLGKLFKSIVNRFLLLFFATKKSKLLKKIHAYEDWWRDDKAVFLGQILYYILIFLRFFSFNIYYDSFKNVEKI